MKFRGTLHGFPMKATGIFTKFTAGSWSRRPPAIMLDSLQDLPGIFVHVFFPKIPYEIPRYISTSSTKNPREYRQKILLNFWWSSSGIPLRVPREFLQDFIGNSFRRSSGIPPKFTQEFLGNPSRSSAGIPENFLGVFIGNIQMHFW